MSRPRKRALAISILSFFPQGLRIQAAEDRSFRERFGIQLEATITIGPDIVAFKRTDFYRAIRASHANPGSIHSLTSTQGVKWQLGIEEAEGAPHVALRRDAQGILLPDFFSLNGDRTRRLARFQEVAQDVNLPASSIHKWRGILKRRGLHDEEVAELDEDLFNTPVQVSRTILEDIESGSSKLATLVPLHAFYYDRLIGAPTEAGSIEEYAGRAISEHLAQLIEWDPVEGSRLALLLAGHFSVLQSMDDKTFARIDLRALAEWARDHGDLISQLGMMELGARGLPKDPGLETPLVAILEQLLAENPEAPEGRLPLLSACFILAEGELSRTKALGDSPPFRRRLASLAQASLIARQVVGNVETGRFVEWAWKQRSHLFFCQTLADLRLEPRWMPDLASADQIYRELMGRLASIPSLLDAAPPDGPLRELLLGDAEGTLRSRVSVSSFWPGPLEGTPSKLPKPVPEEISALIREGLASPTLEPRSFFALMNSRGFTLDPSFIDLAIASLRQAKHRLRDDDGDRLSATYFGLAAIAASERRPDLAAELRILVRRGRRELAQPVTPLEELRLAMTAAASHSDISEWYTFAGDWAFEISHGELSQEDAGLVLTELDQLVQVAPDLARGFDRARAALSAFLGI
jgi:hypothetical protein